MIRSDMSPDISLAQDHSEVDIILGQVFKTLGAGDANAALKELDLFWARLAVHIRAEHLVLFPALIEHNNESTDKITALRDDHDFFMKELADLIKMLRQAADGTEVDLAAIASRLTVMKDRLKNHNRIEEADIYPLAASFDTNFHDRIDAQLHNLPPRFASQDQ